ncbi:MAG TPA: hypothetical protein VNG95_01955 [Gemmatimonadales bacterium]|nr:hypothetical protein [Gemmatimonadales bacterium]
MSPDLNVITGSAIADFCAANGLRVLVRQDDIVAAERPVVGVRDLRRGLVAQRDPTTGQWRASIVLRRGLNHYEIVQQRSAFRDLLHFEIWMGGCWSVQTGPAEVAAIQSLRVA